MAEQFIFGYGSLAAFAMGLPARLEGHRRTWGVAMDNRITIPGYKYYRRPDDNSRPAVFVAFLDIVADADAATSGALLSVDDAALSSLDRRERNYERVEVTGAIRDPPGTVWAYRGTGDGRERLRIGRLAGSAVIARSYLEHVRRGFDALEIDADIDPHPLPVVDLERVDLGPN